WCHEDRFAVHGYTGETTQHALHFWSNDAEFNDQVLRLGIASLRFEDHQLTRERRNAVLDLGRIEGERAVAAHHEGAKIEKVVHLNSRAAAMRFSDAETDGAEPRSQELLIHRSFELVVKGSFVNQVLMCGQSGR